MARGSSTLTERAKRLHHAEEQLEKKLTALKRLVASIRLWQRRAKYYASELEKTDDERAHERAERERKAQERAQRQRRIKL